MILPFFTTGPWAVEVINHVDLGVDEYNVISSDDMIIAKCGVTGEAFCDANLIAAAPELYHALEALLLRCEGLDNALLWQCINALKKARGENE